MSKLEIVKPSRNGALFDGVTMLWEGWAKDVFIGVFSSEQDALRAVLMHNRAPANAH